MSDTPHLLVAEDDPIGLEILLENLSDAGYAVDSAEDGDTTWALLAANPERYCAILLDRMMPGIDGIEVLRRVKADAALAHIPVIMQSALDQPEEVLEGLRGGAYYYLTKPFAADTLLAIVNTAVRDFRHTLEIRDEARKAARTLIHLEHATFLFRTPDEARDIATLLANACLDGEKVALGLSELMLNAIEHGNLGITYQEKSQLIAAGGLEEEITRRLADPVWGERRARIEFERGSQEICFLLCDQGAGFEWLDFLEMRPERAFDTHGRGIAMAKMLSFDSLEYRGCGNEVEATVRLNRGQSFGHDVVIAKATDISGRKHLEEALRISRERLEFALQGADDGLWDWNLETNGVYYSPRWKSMLGYGPDELEDTLETWANLVEPEAREPTLAQVRAYLDGKSDKYETEFRMRHKDGHWVDVLARARLAVDANGVALQPRRLVGTHVDISARKQSETELRRSNAELEQFAYAVSHDMRQPLRMIASYQQLLEKALGDKLDNDTREYLRFATGGAKRLDQMLVGLLDYSRVGRKTVALDWVASREVLDEALLFLKPSLDEARAQVWISGDWPRLHASHDELLRLFQNLIGNAVKYRAADGSPEIDVVGTLVGTLGDARWTARIRDNGIGIDPAQIPRLFQVFQRLQSHTRYEGAGIGLALCRKIVEHHGGHIHAESAGEGQGSTFVFELPLSSPPPSGEGDKPRSSL